jgi:hypothetical protein
MHWYTNPEWWLCILGFFTLLFLGWQSWETRKAAKATKESAKAMWDSIRLQEKAERAWLIIRSSMDGYVPSVDDDLRYWWILENVGKTPGRIIETQCKYELVHAESLTNLPPTPQYPEPIVRNGFLIAPDDKVDYYTMLLRFNDGHPVVKGEMGSDLIAGIQIGAYDLRVYGYVKYLDGITEEPKESRFCDYYVWPFKQRPERATGFRPLIGVPPEYTKCT